MRNRAKPTALNDSAAHFPAHGPIADNGKEILLSLQNVDINFGKGSNLVQAVKNATFDIYKGETFSSLASLAPARPRSAAQSSAPTPAQTVKFSTRAFGFRAKYPTRWTVR